MPRSGFEITIFRIAFTALMGVLAAAYRPFGLGIAASALVGLAVGLGINLLELRVRRASLSSLVSGCAGALIGTLIGVLLVSVLSPGVFVSSTAVQFFRLTVPLLCAFVGLLAGAAKAHLINLQNIGFLKADVAFTPPAKILDTSVIIDGRICEIAESGFLEGEVLVPQFVLHELQQVADSSDSAKRNRGRRGLDVVQRLQKTPRVRLEISGQDFPAVREVDLKLIELAKSRGAKIVTNDFNLNKLAQVQGVEVLNINELANALKPVVLPGEAMRVFILKEGKEYNQGVAYLDDGTMVVVDNAKRLISKTIDITVTSVLQTTAGKMIFGKYDERTQAEHRPPAGHLSATASAGSSSSTT
ncbi:MAG TPA: PIN domain-containing protein [Bryobacteraceae bacterium]|nr:PIN domain-containing protein [Bryobacteraceae bacterium]